MVEHHVKGFYYTASASLNAGDDVEAVDTTGTTNSESDDSTTSDASSEMQPADNQGMMNGAEQSKRSPGGGKMGIQGDFTVTGYSSDEAMTSFVNGTSSI